jgi:hypothetical protein
MPLDLDLCPFVTKVELKNVNVNFHAKVGYWASTSHLQDYKIYGAMIKMFMLKFFINLPQPFGNNPWPTHPTNRNFKTRFHQQCDYLLGFQAPKKINNSILEKKWSKNESNAKDNPCEAPALTYSKEMDQLVEANIITNDMEEKDSTICADVRMMELDDEKKSMMP